MPLVRSLLLAGAAVAGLAILAPTVARELNTHRVTVQLPDGGTETIEYSGHVVPRLIVHPAPVLPSWTSWPAAFADPSFAVLDRIMTAMDRQMAVMMQQADLLTRAESAPLSQAVLQGLPPGTTSFSMVQTSSGNGVCTRVTRITRGAGDAKPQVVSESSGCDGRGAVQPANPGLLHVNYLLPGRPL